MDIPTHPPLDARPVEGAPSLNLSLLASERRWLLIALDLLALNAGLVLALAIRPDLNFEWALLVERPKWFLLLSLLWLPLAFTFDAYDVKVAERLDTAARAVLKAGVVTLVIYHLVPYLPPPLPPSRSSLFLSLLLPLTLVLVERALFTQLLTQPVFQRRILIVGAGWAGNTIAQAIAEHCDHTYRVLGFVDDDHAKQAHNGGAPSVLGDRQSLKDLIQERGVNTLVLAITRELDGELFQILMDCLELGVEIVPLPVLYEQLTGRVPIEHVGDNWYVAMPLRHPGTGAVWPILNRLFDIVSAGLGLIFLAITFPFIAAAIYLDSPGPIFYRQERVGKGGRRFWVYKFRSMIPNAENGAAVWARENDSRITRVGRLLRKTHIDEFPQFINILRGEMSAVGPRPERPEFVEKLAQQIPFYRVRHAVKPGMAGWGLVKQGYSGSEEDAILKLQYDLYYIKHQSLWLDLVILLKTVLDTVSFGGR